METKYTNIIIEKINDKYSNIMNLINTNKINSFSLNRLKLMNSSLENILNEMEEFELDLEIKYTRENKKIKQQIIEMNQYNENLKLLLPYIVLLNSSNNSENDYIYCNECNKKIFGKDYLRRYRQHFNAKHRN